MEANRYTDTVRKLKEFSVQRDNMRERVVRLRRMRDALEPLSSAERVQENLITRNGEVERELERMRMLLVRVAGRVGQLPDAVAGSNNDVATSDLNDKRKRNIDDFLSDLAVFPPR